MSWCYYADSGVRSARDPGRPSDRKKREECMERRTDRQTDRHSVLHLLFFTRGDGAAMHICMHALQLYSTKIDVRVQKKRKFQVLINELKGTVYSGARSCLLLLILHFSVGQHILGIIKIFEQTDVTLSYVFQLASGNSRCCMCRRTWNLEYKHGHLFLYEKVKW